MKTPCWKEVRLLSILCGGLAAWAPGPWARAQDGPALEIALYPGIRVTGEVGATYVIESKTEVEGDFWLTRGWIELMTPTAIWMDPVPSDSPRKVYRAVKIIRPRVQTIADMVWIPPGTLVMGSPEGERGRYDWEGPETRVTLTTDFWLGKYELTQREYMALMGTNPSCNPGDLNRPVECVSWDDAVAYCRKLTQQERTAGRLPTGYVYRLPTEAEWEYACRAGTTTRYSFGDALGCDDERSYCALLDSYMWWGGNNTTDDTYPVGRKLPNPWGLYDMHGNVWEWCTDFWSDSLPGGTVTDPKGLDSGSIHVIRGGYWDALGRRCRSAIRSSLLPGYLLNSGLGFRVVLAPGQ